MARNRQRALQGTKQDARDQKIAELFLCEHRTYRQIAKEVKCSLGLVAQSIDRIRTQWRTEAVLDVGERTAKELARLDRVEREAWAAWERSKLDAETRESVRTKDGLRRSRKRQGQCGDPRFLEIVARCHDRRAVLLGLTKQEINLHQQVAVTGDGPTQINAIDPLLLLRQEPDYVEYLRHRALAADAADRTGGAANGKPGPVGANGKPGPLANGQAPKPDRPSDNGHAHGPGPEAPNDLLPPTPRQERTD